MDQNEMKKLVGIESSKYVEDGMIVGLGTGSTAEHMVREIARRMDEEGLKIIGVTTSNVTTKLANQLGIPLKSIDEVDHVDLTIDGADEISADFQGIKGGGAALLFEKIVAVNSKKVIWIVDESKMVEKLGKFPLPIEVVQYGSEQLFRKWKAKGYQPTYRMNGFDKAITDSGNYIIDLHLGQIDDVEGLAAELDTTVGVVEHGLFVNLVAKVITGHNDGKIETFEVTR
jgi:ribose 5-phosphate isomerase A